MYIVISVLSWVALAIAILVVVTFALTPGYRQFPGNIRILLINLPSFCKLLFLRPNYTRLLTTSPNNSIWSVSIGQ